MQLSSLPVRPAGLAVATARWSGASAWRRPLLDQPMPRLMLDARLAEPECECQDVDRCPVHHGYD